MTCVWMHDRGRGLREGRETIKSKTSSVVNVSVSGIKSGQGRRAVGSRIREVGTAHLLPGLSAKGSESYPKCFSKPLSFLKGMTLSDSYFRKIPLRTCGG